MCVYISLLIGKTTLLKLLAGRMYTGEFDGIRVINGQTFPPRDYDEVRDTHQ
jgi:ABC-type molybdenum transport system ATPase subunit/photorepair protein PhrA